MRDGTRTNTGGAAAAEEEAVAVAVAVAVAGGGCWALTDDFLVGVFFFICFGLPFRNSRHLCNGPFFFFMLLSLRPMLDLDERIVGV